MVKKKRPNLIWFIERPPPDLTDTEQSHLEAKQQQSLTLRLQKLQLLSQLHATSPVAEGRSWADDGPWAAAVCLAADSPHFLHTLHICNAEAVKRNKPLRREAFQPCHESPWVTLDRPKALNFCSSKLVLYAGPTPTGTSSTFNYLIDTLLAIPDIRSMYMRRLRSLMDEYTDGKLEGVRLAFS